MALRLQELWERYRFDDVNFQDETFFTGAPRRGIRRRIIESGMKITWAATMRADQGVRLPMSWARCAVGAARLLVGVESGSNQMLRRIKKRHQIEQVFETVKKMLHTASPAISPSLSASRKKTMRAFGGASISPNACAPSVADFQTPIYYFKPYPGSEMVIEAVARGFRLPGASRRGPSSTTWRGSRGPGCRAKSSSSLSASSSSASSHG